MLVSHQDIQPIVYDVWNEKYRYVKPDGSSDEESREDTLRRVANGVYQHDTPQHRDRAIKCMVDGYWLPGGRILAGAGTGRDVTLINCYVLNTIHDSMASSGDSIGIMDSLSNAAYTLQKGGGIGQDFSTLRPKGALVAGVGSESTGPLAFMDTWDAMCQTIRSAGYRRGAMMGTLRVDHPDIFEFVTAKQQKGRLTNFNVSVLITDEFMEAVKNDRDFELRFQGSGPKDGSHVYYSEESKTYVYRVVRARELWNTILKNTYEYSEPGVIFIDRINERNNLWYCEDIRATNPCGEQPLPPHGACNLGHVNLALCVEDPFTETANVDWSAINEAVSVGVRFLDNVYDVTEFPLEGQAEEAKKKRRVGLGITGLANFLQQLGIRYGSKEAVRVTESVMSTISERAYLESCHLSQERGPFPMFDAEAFLRGHVPSGLSANVQNEIRQYGIRNGCLLTVAPVGTGSLFFDNISSGIEPTFEFVAQRAVRQNGDGTKDYTVEDYAYRKYLLSGKLNGSGLPPYMVTSSELNIDEHLVMQAACQKYVDSSISKTLNCPEDMTYEEFKDVYAKAYDLGLKGVTTYRPNEVRGSVLSSGTKVSTDKKSIPDQRLRRMQRPHKVEGTTYKLKWTGPGEGNYYITINDNPIPGSQGPFECFIYTTTGAHEDWLNVMSRLISAIFRLEADSTFIVRELNKIHAPSGGGWVDGKYIPSLAAAIGRIIEEHMMDIGYLPMSTESKTNVVEPSNGQKKLGSLCPKCFTYAYVQQEGCGLCHECGHSSCG